MNVVLPAPFGPSTATTCPRWGDQVQAVERAGLAVSLLEAVGLDRSRHFVSSSFVFWCGGKERLRDLAQPLLAPGDAPLVQVLDHAAQPIELRAEDRNAILLLEHEQARQGGRRLAKGSLGVAELLGDALRTEVELVACLLNRQAEQDRERGDELGVLTAGVTQHLAQPVASDWRPPSVIA